MMREKIPLVSVIIPAHNSAQTIADAVASIQQQTFTNLEIIVVDDHSSDQTKRIAEAIARNDSRVKCVSLPFQDPKRFNKTGRNINAGYSARNYGVDQARGDWVAFQDADDVSLLNRIEWQLTLAQKYNASHVCTGLVPYKEAWDGKMFDVTTYLKDNPDRVILSKELCRMAKKAKGSILPLLGGLRSKIPFEVKTARVLNKLFFGNLKPYPAAAGLPFVKKEVFAKVRFRSRDERVWPSFVGRGTDRDFDFQVAETFGNSVVVNVPLYMWRQDSKDFDYAPFEKYIS